jgi:starch synthase
MKRKLDKNPYFRVSIFAFIQFEKQAMAKPLSILFVTSEVYPFAKTGGLADVSYSLPLALRELGHDIRVMAPKYGSISERKNRIHEINRLRDIPIPIGETESYATVKSSSINNPRSKVQAYITTNSNYFDANKGFYSDPATGLDYPDNDERFVFFGHSVIQTCMLLGWVPDIIHCNDWQTGILPALIRLKHNDLFAKTKIIYTIHNFGLQGDFPMKSLTKTGFSTADADALSHKKKVNFMKAGIHFSDCITTVSPTYAKEVLADQKLSNGLSDVLKTKPDRMVGIAHGVDLNTWNPKIDTHLTKNYDKSSIENKAPNKETVLERFNLPIHTDRRVPLIAMVTRIIDQKGIQLILDAEKELFSKDIQFVMLGEGDHSFYPKLEALAKKYPEKFAIRIQFDDELAHLMEAGADMFLMPSKYEPCGLNQQYSLVYGTVPIVRSTGGLADTVTDFDKKTGEGTGFVFKDYTAKSMISAIEKAIKLFDEEESWNGLILNGMNEDRSWGRAARQYSELYRALMKDTL